MSDPDCDNVVLLVGNEQAPAASQQFRDQSPLQHALTAEAQSGDPGGVPRFAAEDNPPGMRTVVFFPTGQGGRISTEAVQSPDLLLGTEDFCIEGFFRPAASLTTFTAISNGQMFRIEANAGTWQATINDTSGAAIINNAVIGAVANLQWQHVAFYREGEQFIGAVNGTITIVGTSAAEIFATSDGVCIGGNRNWTGTPFQGDACSIRITRNDAVYPAEAFTPPGLPLRDCSRARPVIFNRASGMVGVPFVYEVQASGNPTAFTATNMPPGLAISATGEISGTPTAPGIYDVELNASNETGHSVCSATLVITIEPLPLYPLINSPLSDTATQGVAYAYQITASNNPVSFNATELPQGLSVSTTTGMITGTPVGNPGTWTIPLSATNEHGTGRANLILTLLPAAPPTPLPVITSPDTASGTVGLPFVYVITARNVPHLFSASGLPPGLAVNTDTGTISGVPLEVGTFHATIAATNQAGSATAGLVLSIAPTPAERPCPPPPHVKSTSGPDVPAILCYTPDGCCGPSPCDITEDDMICQIRSLLPEGEAYNNTAASIAATPPQYGSITVGCARVGCEQLILGGCCGQDVIPCQADAVAPQLAVVDAFGAAAFGVLQALCQLLFELDPCTAKLLVRQWADRMGIKHPDPCGPGWSDRILVFLICFITQLRMNQTAVNWEFLTYVASRMSAEIKMRYAGDMNGTANSDEPYLNGWWTMARDKPVCPPRLPCPPDEDAQLGAGYDRKRSGQALDTVGCAPPNEFSPLSLNIIICPSDIVIPDNCNLPAVQSPLPFDREMYEAFWWLLPQLLPRGPLYCIYECCPADCIV